MFRRSHILCLFPVVLGAHNHIFKVKGELPSDAVPSLVQHRWFSGFLFACLSCSPQRKARGSHPGLLSSQSDAQRYTRGTSPICWFFPLLLAFNVRKSYFLQPDEKIEESEHWPLPLCFLQQHCFPSEAHRSTLAPKNELLSRVKPCKCQVWALFK